MDLIESVRIALNILIDFWWVYIPPLLFWLLIDIWSEFNRAKYLSSLKWVLLRIKFPSEIAAAYKAMEQVFANLHGVYGKDLDWDDKFFGGKSVDWFSFEITGSDGNVSFYIRTLEDHRNLVESSIYAQYPEAEISEAADYTDSLEGEVPSDEYDIFGMELAFNEDDFYPIRTYEYFEDVPGAPRAPRIDPLASFSELLGSLRLGEHIWVQTLIEPTDSKWAKGGESKVAEIIEGKKVDKKRGFFSSALDDVLNFATGTQPETKEEEKHMSRVLLSPKDTNTTKAIANKASKLGFKSTIRFVYIAKKDIFSKATGAAITGMFKQFAAPNLNGFKPNNKTMPKAGWSLDFMGNWPFKLIPYPWEEAGVHERKKKLFGNYADRSLGDDTIVLNTEELATMFHLPSIEVKAPLLERIEARKGTPPSSLPVKENE